MTSKKALQIAMAAGLSAVIGLGATACSRDYTSDYVYTVSAANGNINAFGVDYQSGILVQINGSPFTTGFTRETTLVPSPDGKNLYVLSGFEDSKVEQFSIGTDGKLYGAHTYSIAGSSGATYPTAMAVDTTGKFLYITFTYQPGFTPVSPGPGGVAVFPINSDGSLGTNVSFNGLPYLGVGNNPVGVTVTPPTCSPTPVISTNTSCSGSNGSGAENVFVYIVDQEASNPTVLGYAQNTSTGALTPLSGTSFNSSLNTWQGYQAGVSPSAIAADPTGRYVYVTDKTADEIYQFRIDNQLTGNLTAITYPVATGAYPVALVIDPRGKYLYTANFNAGSVSGFAIDAASGALTAVAAGSGMSIGTGPSCITIEPSLGTYIYTSNYQSNDVSAGQLSPNTGALTGVSDSPFTVSQLPACIASVPNGPHAFQTANP